MASRQLPAILLAALVASSCASAPQSAWAPQIDSRGVDQTRYARDLNECQAYAKAAPGTDANKEATKSAKKWGIGTAAGLVAFTVATGGIGALAAIPMVAGSTAVTVGGGAAVGGYTSKNIAEAKYHSIVGSCLAGLGYHVLS